MAAPISNAPGLWTHITARTNPDLKDKVFEKKIHDGELKVSFTSSIGMVHSTPFFSGVVELVTEGVYSQKEINRLSLTNGLFALHPSQVVQQAAKVDQEKLLRNLQLFVRVTGRSGQGYLCSDLGIIQIGKEYPNVTLQLHKPRNTEQLTFLSGMTDVVEAHKFHAGQVKKHPIGFKGCLLTVANGTFRSVNVSDGSFLFYAREDEYTQKGIRVKAMK